MLLLLCHDFMANLGPALLSRFCPNHQELPGQNPPRQ